VTISVGVAVARTADIDVQDVLRRADEALYEAKRRGRDQVWVADAEDHPERPLAAVGSVAEEVTKSQRPWRVPGPLYGCVGGGDEEDLQLLPLSQDNQGLKAASAALCASVL
jgi:hypothetical protein